MRSDIAVALLLCTGVGLAGAQTSRQTISAAAEWQPGMATFQSILKRCMNAPNPDACKAKALKESGAPPAAIAFSELTGYDGFMRAFRAVGPVDVAYVLYPYRANENNGVLLVNGDPPVIDVDDDELIPKDDLRADPLYATLLQTNPGLIVWPGDRFDARYPVAEKLPGGGQRFLVFYQLQTCHACAELGEATFAFDFDRTGKFDGTKLWVVNAGGTAAADAPSSKQPVIVSTSPSKPVELAVGQPLNLMLATNPSTGYQWQLAAPFDQAVLRFTSSLHIGPEAGRVGASGQVILGFTAAQRGKSVISLKYVRPWERKAPPGKTMTVRVIVK
jgi:predicted secreted protein